MSFGSGRADQLGRSTSACFPSPTTISACRSSPANVDGLGHRGDGSYVLNSTITFAAESGRQLGWRDYFDFRAVGITGCCRQHRDVWCCWSIWFVDAGLGGQVLAIAVSFVRQFLALALRGVPREEVIRHPGLRAKRSSKDEWPGPSPFEARPSAEHLRVTALKPRFQLGVERIVAREHVVEIGHRHRFGAVLAQNNW